MAEHTGQAIAERKEATGTMTTGLTVSVVVCCYTERRWEQIRAAIDSLVIQTVRPDQIILVVDHNPALLGRARDEFDDLTIVENSEQRGLSGARNSGVAVATGEVIAFLDDDAVAEPRWVEALIDEYADPRVGGVGGHVEPVWLAGRPRWFPTEFDWVVGCSHSGMPDSSAPVRNFVGANMSFRRDVLERAGGFRAELGRVGTRPVGCEETELCIRATASNPGAVLRYQPEAAVRHHVPADRGTLRYFLSRCYAEGTSKAAVADLTSTGDALSAERDYVRRTLPAGVAAGLRSFAAGKGGLGAAAAIAVGLLATSVGYAIGRTGLVVRPFRVAVAVLTVAVLSCALSLIGVQPTEMSDLGLLSVLPPAFWAGLLALAATVAVLIRRHAPTPLLIVGLLLLILVIHATPAWLYDAPRYAWAWKHTGIVDFILRHSAVDPDLPNLTAYHAWPGFFAVNALVVAGGSTGTALSYAAWAPPVFGAVVLVPLYQVFSALTADRRQRWMGLLIFTVTNWVGQDYFSPQAFCFLLFLTVLAICLRWLPARKPMRGKRSGEELAADGASPASRRLLVCVVLLLTLVIAGSHQLTPFMLLSALTALVLLRRVGPAWLPVALTVITVAWIGFVATTFFRTNLYWIIESIGRPASNTQSTFVDLSSAGPEQTLVAYADRALTAGVGVLALAGLIRLRRRRLPHRVAALLAASPLPLLVGNDYGGEMLFRVYLFGLPFLSLLAAGLFYADTPGRRRRPQWVRRAVAAGLTIVLAAVFCLAYFGKERMNYFTPSEVAGSEWIYDQIPAGTTLVAPNANFPWAFEHYETYTYGFLENLPPLERRRLAVAPIAVVQKNFAPSSGRLVVVLTRSQLIATRYSGTLSVAGVDALSIALSAGAADPNGDRRVRVLYRNPDVVVFDLAPDPDLP